MNKIGIHRDCLIGFSYYCMYYSVGNKTCAHIFLLVITGIWVVHVIKLHIFTFLIPCCDRDVHCKFCIKIMFGSSLFQFVLKAVQVLIMLFQLICILYIY